MISVQFNLSDESERKVVEELIALIRREIQPAAPVSVSSLSAVQSALPSEVVRSLTRLVPMRVGKVLRTAATEFSDGQSFSWPELALKAGIYTETALSLNRSLGRCIRKDVVRHSDFFTVVPGTPKRFVMPPQVRKFVLDLLAFGAHGTSVAPDAPVAA